MSEVASAYVSLIPSAKGFATGVTKQTDAAARTAGKRFGGIFSGSLKSVIGGALAGIGVTRILSDSLGEAREAQKVGALTTQVIKSTGGAANVSAKHVGDLATAISNKIGVDDEAIQSGENLLLTFKNIRNETGRGNNIFDQATHSLVDLAAGMSAASGGELDFRSATTLVGKALNDPVKGLTALSRVGVTFTEGQKDQIKALVKSGDRMKAQKIILKELRSEFGGAAKAQATDADKARVALGNLEEQIGTALLPVVDDLAQKFTKDVVPAISEFITEMQDGTGAGGEVVDVLTDLVDVGKGVFKFFDGLPGPVKKYGIELAIAAIAIGKMNSALGASRLGAFATDMRSAETRAARMSTTLQGLGGVLRNVAGAGGMLLLADSAHRTAGDMSTLEMAAGGALSGAALGAFAGPEGALIGGAIGGLAGAAGGLARQLKSSGDSAANAGPKIDGYAATLDNLTGAITGATEAQALHNLQQNHGIEIGREAGLSSTTLVNASLGMPKALKKVADAQAFVNKVFAEGGGAITAAADGTFTKRQNRALDLGSALEALGPILKLNRAELKKDQQAWTDNEVALGHYKKALPGLPKNLVTNIATTGIEKADQNITRLTAKYHLTPKQVATVLSAAGEKPTAAKVQGIIDKAAALGKMRPVVKVDANTEAALTKLNNLINREWSTVVNILPFVHSPTGRASGGPVLAGQPYIVGERRPELFVPNQSGRIVPRVPSTRGAATTSVDTEQASYRAFSRALAAHQVVIMSKGNLEDLDLLVGAM